MSCSSVVSHYYLKELRRVLHGPGNAIGFALATTMHAVGHAAVALVASALALTLGAGRVQAREASAVHAPSELLFFSTHWAASHPLADRALALSFLGLAVVGVKAASGVYATFVQVKLAGQVGCALRVQLLDRLLSRHRLRQPRQEDHGIDGTAAAPTARAVAALTERVREVEGGLARGLLGGVRAVAQLVPIAGLLVWLSPSLSGMAGAVLVIFGWTLGRLRSGTRKAIRGAARQHELLLEAADESVRHAELWVTYGAERRVRASVRRLGDAIAVGAARLEARASALSGANEVLAAAALAAALAASRAGWLGASPDTGSLFAFALAFFLAYRPLRDLADARLSMARAETAYAALAEIVQADPAPLPSNASHDGQRCERRWPLGVLDVCALRLARGIDSPLTLRIEPGAIAVLMGPTGVGKTTLLRTLLGLQGATGGDIYFDGQALGASPAGPAHRPFAWVPQDAPLLAEPLEVNVGLGFPDVDMLAALAPLGAAHLPAAFEGARLGAGGRAVSGGERQWIAIARAIATQQPILLLDEPTNGLDEDAQSVVLSAIARLRGRRTVLLVTHRPEPMAIADVVWRIDSGGATLTHETRDPGQTAV